MKRLSSPASRELRSAMSPREPGSVSLQSIGSSIGAHPSASGRLAACSRPRRTLGFHASALLQKRVAERQTERQLGFLLQRKSEKFYEALGLELTRATRDATGIVGRATVQYLDDLTPLHVAAAITDLGKGCDALAIVAADHPRITEAVERVRDRAVPVFTLLSDISAPGTDRVHRHRPSQGGANGGLDRDSACQGARPGRAS